MATAAKSPPADSVKTAQSLDSILAAKAKTHLLQLLDTVDRGRQSITITKPGRPIAQLVPIRKQERTPLWGCMKGTVRITGDIVGPEPDLWEAMTE